MTGWLCLQTFARSEFDLERAINEQGFTALCPRYVHHGTVRYDQRKVTTSERPLYPSYLFVRPHEEFSPVAFWTGKLRVRVINDWRTISDAAVEAISEIAAEASRAPVEVKNVIEAGTFVTVLHGAFKGHTAAVLRERGKKAFLAIGHRWGDEVAVLKKDLAVVSPTTLAPDSKSAIPRTGQAG